MNNKKFRIDIVGDLEYEDLVADIYYKSEFVAMLKQEQGFQNLEIEIHPPKNREFWNFYWSEFSEIVERAKQGLWDLRKRDDS